MGQSVANLSLKVQSLNDLIQEKGNGLVQQCLSTPHFLCFQVRFKGKTIYFYLGRGAQYQGFDFSRSKPGSPLRVQDKFLQYARKYWRGMLISKCLPHPQERCLEFQGYIKKAPARTWFFWRGRDLFFAHGEIRGTSTYFFKSWVGKCSVSQEHFLDMTPEEVFADVGFLSLKTLGERKGDLDVDQYLSRFTVSPDRDDLNEKSSKGDAKIQKTITKIEQDLTKFKILDFLQKETEKDLTNIKKIGEGRFSVDFRGLEGHFKKREFLFDKIKKWKKSQAFLKDRLNSLKGNSTKEKKVSERLSLGKTIQPIWKESKLEQRIEKKEKYIELKLGDLKIFLGRSALENDFIRKTLAKKDDLWLHLEGQKSGHMFIKSPTETLGHQEFTILGSALVELNNIEIQDIPLIYTQVKNLKGVKGTPGMVNYKKEKHIVVYFDREWRQKLTSIDVGDDG